MDDGKEMFPSEVKALLLERYPVVIGTVRSIRDGYLDWQNVKHFL
jgi:hypothetical protein